VFSRLYRGETNFNIVERWKLWFALSGAVIAIGFVALFANGLNLGIDFTGGTVWEVPAGNADPGAAEAAVRDLGYNEVQVQEVTQSTGGGSTRMLRVEAEATASPSKATTAALAKADSALRKLESQTKGDSAKALRGVRSQLNGIDGPFEQDVPEALTALQNEIDSLTDVLKEAKDDETELVSTSVSKMRNSVEALGEAEQAERERVGQAVSDELAKITGSKVSEVTVDTVGPSWGEQISQKAQTALIVFLLAIMLYISLRFEFKMALATVAALLHDLFVVVGLYALFQFPVTPATVIAVLTILGFSIYDGIVVFDRVDENSRTLGRKSKMTYSQMANMSLNQVLMRSLNTSITALLPILSVLILGSLVLGAKTLEDFGLALFLGLMSGAYSSLYIATPLLAVLKEREPRYRELREQLGDASQGDSGSPQGATLSAGVASGSGPLDDVVPRARKLGKKR